MVPGTRAAALVSLCFLMACGRIGFERVENDSPDGAVSTFDAMVIPSEGICGGQPGAVTLAEVTVDYSAGAVLTDYAIRVALDTHDWIEQGALAADCSNLELATDAGPLAIWVSEHACGESDTAVWVKLPLHFDRVRWKRIRR
jgi:hypothetical protein